MRSHRRVLLDRVEPTTVERDTSIVLIKYSDRRFKLMVGDQVEADEKDVGTIAGYSYLALDIVPLRQLRVGIIGAGLCILPRLIADANLAQADLFEIEQEIVDWNRITAPWRMIMRRWTWHVGDYRSTLPAATPNIYDVLVADTSGDHDENWLMQYVAPGGRLVVSSDTLDGFNIIDNPDLEE